MDSLNEEIKELWKYELLDGKPYLNNSRTRCKNTFEDFQYDCLNTVDNRSKSIYEEYRSYGCGSFTSVIMLYWNIWEHSSDINAGELLKKYWGRSLLYWIEYGIKKIAIWIWSHRNEPFILMILGAFLTAYALTIIK